jgi:1,4-dihydroxy-2-naphthoyl-CoA hydrolase
VDVSLDDLNAIGADVLPGHLGVVIDEAESGLVKSHMEVQQHHMAPHGYLHAASVIALADTSCGYGCMLSLPEGGTGFTTIELKSNFLRTVREGTITCEARIVHGGRTTQIWDATVTTPDGRQLALFRCTQLVLRAD